MVDISPCGNIEVKEKRTTMPGIYSWSLTTLINFNNSIKIYIIIVLMF